MNGAELYFDTSALLPYYRTEPATDLIQALLIKARPPVPISELTRVETASTIARWVRTQELDEVQAVLLESTIAGDIEAGLFVVRSFTPAYFQQAEQWLLTRKTALRTLDALHLACCRATKAKLITCDKVMHQAAQTLGIPSLLITSS